MSRCEECGHRKASDRVATLGIRCVLCRWCLARVLDLTDADYAATYGGMRYELPARSTDSVGWSGLGRWVRA